MKDPIQAPELVKMVREGDTADIYPSHLRSYAAALNLEDRAKVTESGCYEVRCGECVCGSAYVNPCCDGLCMFILATPCCCTCWPYDRLTGGYGKGTGAYMGKADDENETLACYCTTQGEGCTTDCIGACCFCYKKEEH